MLYTLTRSVKKWCLKNGVEIFHEEGSNKKYLITMQFESARLKKFIDYLKEKFKEKWLDAFQVYMSMNITNVIELEESKIVHFVKDIKQAYKPTFHHEKRFLTTLLKITPEL